jgi:regulator of cell morphogenesis and NO signaling
MTEVSTTTTIGDIVARDLRSAAVFARHGIDFCCGGRRSLAEACREHGLDTQHLIKELRATSSQDGDVTDVTAWPIQRVLDRIVSKHHAYVRRQIPVIQGYASKLVAKHRRSYAELPRVAELFAVLAGDLLRHLEKEERILFPFIEAMRDTTTASCCAPRTPFGTIQNPIRMMELEHQDAGLQMWLIRVLTNHFQPPEQACVTWRAFYAELENFERDLHEHVHLENNVLFPAAERLENELRSMHS